MRKHLNFALMAVWILLSRAYDAWCTYQHTPDLQKEANPLVTVLGLGWAPLLLVVGGLTLYAVYTYYLVVYKTKNLLPQEKGFTFSNLVAYLQLGRKDEWPAIFYKLPRSWSRFNQYAGHTLPQCVAWAGVVSTVMWLLINYAPWYGEVHNVKLIYGVLVLGCLVLTYRWMKAQYELYLIQNQ